MRVISFGYKSSGYYVFKSEGREMLLSESSRVAIDFLQHFKATTDKAAVQSGWRRWSAVVDTEAPCRYSGPDADAWWERIQDANVNYYY